MSKTQKSLIKIRRTWNINPDTKIVDSKKIYKRSAFKREVDKERREFEDEYQDRSI